MVENWPARITEEVFDMTRRPIDREAIRRSVARSTRESARLEGRVVPAQFKRSPSVDRYIAEHRRHD